MFWNALSYVLDCERFPKYRLKNLQKGGNYAGFFHADTDFKNICPNVLCCVCVCLTGRQSPRYAFQAA